MNPPVSPIRDSAKQRVLRIPLDYYKRTTGLERVKWLLSAGVLLVAGVYAAGTVVAWRRHSPLAARQFSPGPVASVHFAWNDRCEACHESGVPLRHDARGIDQLTRWITGRSTSPRATMERRCTACHPGAAHHPSQIDAENLACTACHRDHAGRDADLTRVDDGACTSCHRDIARHRRSDAEASPASLNIASWTDHPEFRSLDRDDPGRVKFNHRLHLLPGQYPRDAKPTALKRLSSIDPSYWVVLGYPDDTPPDTVVQLDCAACHEFDASARTRVGGESTGVPSSGAYAQPIRYERHCASCHAADLAVTLPVAGGVARGDMPHGLRPAAIQTYLAGLAVVPRAPPPRLTPPRPIPGRDTDAADANSATIDLSLRLSRAERDLQGLHRCGKCHSFVPETPDADASDTRAPLPPDVAPTAIPAVWLRHGNFDHAAHRAVRCVECHAAVAFAWDHPNKPPADDAKPLIPKIQNCRQCHGQAKESAVGGVRFDCVTCHRYHAAHLPPHGPGAPSRSLPQDRRRGAAEFLSGHAPDVAPTDGSPVK